MEKRGFTLIELLAVIVVLAIVSVVVTPIVVTTIDDAKKGAFKNSAYGLIKTAEIEYMTNKLNLDNKSENLIFEYADGKIVGEKDLDYKGYRPERGKIIIAQDGRVGLAITSGIWCAKKDYDSNEVIIEKTDENNCKMPFLCGYNLFDERDGKTYKTTKIGKQCWFAENLKHTGNGCLGKIWDSSDTGPVDACKSYGDEIHYQWGAAMNGITIEGTQGLCPSGWHIPTDAEWKILEGTVDSKYDVGDSVWDNTGYRGSDVGKKLKAVDGGGTDDYGFNGLLVGGRLASGSMYYGGSDGLWWSSSPSGSDAWVRVVDSSYDYVGRSTSSQANGLSVRCVRD